MAAYRQLTLTAEVRMDAVCQIIILINFCLCTVYPLAIDDSNICHRLPVFPLQVPRDMCACKAVGRSGVIRLGSVAVKSGLKNELLYAPPSTAQGAPAPVLVFFGGDVQDYPEVMAAHRDNGRYVEWSLTATTSILSSKFPSHHVFVVKPSRMERKTFSCYDNFVLSNLVGAPTHMPGISAIGHLNNLISEGLKSAVQAQNINQETQSISTESVDDLTLIGFSKGCVVLNQLITEFHCVKNFGNVGDKVPYNFIQKISNLYWLDGGHAGGSKTWITDSLVLNSLASFDHIKIHVHVTPYQIEDEQRPWIRRECKSFRKILERAGRKINYKLHFVEEISLLAHFRLLNDFA